MNALIDSINRLLRINRYIMECKFKELAVRTDSDTELIDTLWNVNGQPGVLLHY